MVLVAVPCLAVGVVVIVLTLVESRVPDSTSTDTLPVVKKDAVPSVIDADNVLVDVTFLV